MDVMTRIPALGMTLLHFLAPSATPVWSGGVAFSYFPATSDAGQFGMVIYLRIYSYNIVLTLPIYKLRMVTVSFINVPTQSNAPAASYPCMPRTKLVLHRFIHAPSYAQ
jgi:hypothetical protein